MLTKKVTTPIKIQNKGIVVWPSFNKNRIPSGSTSTISNPNKIEVAKKPIVSNNTGTDIA